MKPKELILCSGKRKAKAWCQSKAEFIYQEEISHGADSLSAPYYNTLSLLFKSTQIDLGSRPFSGSSSNITTVLLLLSFQGKGGLQWVSPALAYQVATGLGSSFPIEAG